MKEGENRRILGDAKGDVKRCISQIQVTKRGRDKFRRSSSKKNR